MNAFIQRYNFFIKKHRKTLFATAAFLLLVLMVHAASVTYHNHYGWVITASYYGRKFHGKKTASGEVYNMYALTAAHKTLPLGTKLKVTNLDNERSVIVKINDRGPYSRGRSLDLSLAAARRLKMVKQGTAKVRIKIIE
jgi:rare lipoprotein A